MISCMAALYLAVHAAGPAGWAQSIDPDALYQQRENLALAQQASDVWASRAASGRDFEAAWKLARASYWLGTQLPERDRRAALDRGVKAGELATKIDATKPEGHFWLAANMGTLAESYGLTQGIKYRGRIKDALLRVLAINPAWMQGSADRALGWWYHKVPGLFGGSEATAEATPAQGARLQSAQYGHAVLSLRSRGRARPQGRSADAAPAGTRCAASIPTGRRKIATSSAKRKPDEGDEASHARNLGPRSRLTLSSLSGIPA